MHKAFFLVCFLALVPAILAGTNITCTDDFDCIDGALTLTKSIRTEVDDLFVYSLTISNNARVQFYDSSMIVSDSVEVTQGATLSFEGSGSIILASTIIHGVFHYETNAPIPLEVHGTLHLPLPPQQDSTPTVSPHPIADLPV